MRVGITLGVVLLIAGVLFAWGLISESPLLIGLGFLIIAFCAIWGMQPNWPRPRSQ